MEGERGREERKGEGKEGQALVTGTCWAKLHPKL